METEPTSERRIRIQTLHGIFEGSRILGPRLRTIDDLNVEHDFVTLFSPSEAGFSEDDGGPLAINKSSVLFVTELSNPPVGTSRDFGRFTRGGVRMKAGNLRIDGFVHSPRGGDPMRRFETGHHRFVALTSVLVTGADLELGVPFLAVNRHRVTVVQRVSEMEPDTPELAVAEVSD